MKHCTSLAYKRQLLPQPCRSVVNRVLVQLVMPLWFFLLLLAPIPAPAQWQLRLQNLQWGSLGIAALQFDLPPSTIRSDAANAAENVIWVLQLQQLSLASVAVLDLRLQCTQSGTMPRSEIAAMPETSSVLQQLQACEAGSITLTARDLDASDPAAGLMPPVHGEFSYELASGDLQLNFAQLQLRLRIVPDELSGRLSGELAGGGQAIDWRINLIQLPLTWMQQVTDLSALQVLVQGLSESMLEQMPWPRAGTISGHIAGTWSDQPQQASAMQVDLQFNDVDFDNSAGDIAAAGLNLQLTANASRARAAQHWTFASQLLWHSGEWLLGAFYLPPPATNVSLSVAGEWLPASEHDNGDLKFQQLRWQHDQVIDLQATASWQLAAQPQTVSGTALPPPQPAPDKNPWWPHQWQLASLQVDLPALQSAYLNGWLQTRGLQGLISSGQLSVRSTTAADQPSRRDTSLSLQQLNLADPAGRIAITGLAADIDWRMGASAESQPDQQSAISWDQILIGKLPVTRTTLDFVVADQVLQLQQDSIIPILDGGIMLHDFRLNDFLESDSGLVLDAELLPLSLQQLGAVMGWPKFGGQLAGSIPGISRDGGIWSMDGQIELQVFQGRVAISSLSLERPFGVLPVLSASIWVERMQLEPLTTAFDVGRITGPVDAYVKDLRLLDWQPVSFAAWLRTSPKPKVPLRISQRAVDTLSSVGGGIGSGLQASVLRIFESFRYQQLGLSCTLSNGVCMMGGIEAAKTGSRAGTDDYVLVKGTGIPSLNVVAYNRRVDWQRLLTQLRAAIQSQGAKVQ